jgi:hypothetical protein
MNSVTTLMVPHSSIIHRSKPTSNERVARTYGTLLATCSMFRINWSPMNPSDPESKLYAKSPTCLHNVENTAKQKKENGRRGPTECAGLQSWGFNLRSALEHKKTSCSKLITEQHHVGAFHFFDQPMIANRCFACSCIADCIGSRACLTKREGMRGAFRVWTEFTVPTVRGVNTWVIGLLLLCSARLSPWILPC